MRRPLLQPDVTNLRLRLPISLRPRLRLRLPISLRPRLPISLRLRLRLPISLRPRLPISLRLRLPPAITSVLVNSWPGDVVVRLWSPAPGGWRRTFRGRA